MNEESEKRLPQTLYYSWIPWFRALVQKINDGSEDYLINKAKQVDWTPSSSNKPALLNFGDEGIDPFSFIYFLAAKNGASAENRKATFLSVHKVFELPDEMLSTCPTGELVYPTPSFRSNLLFHDSKKFEPELLWLLFRQVANRDSDINESQFAKVFLINGVGVAKLTQCLFLINSFEFLPIDKAAGAGKAFSPEQSDPERQIKIGGFSTYRDFVSKISQRFPGCEPYEINQYMYLRNNQNLGGPNSKIFQLDTNVTSDGQDHWQKFDSRSCITIEVSTTEIQNPNRGDVILTRTGTDVGRGIGVVLDTKLNEPAENKRQIEIHVNWVNKFNSSLEAVTVNSHFGEIQKNSEVYSVFANVDSYKKTLYYVQPNKLEFLSDPNAVLKAITERNQIGETEFLKKYGFDQSTIYDLVYGGNRYPPKAIAGAAYFHQFGIKFREFKGGKPTNDKLEELGFTIEKKGSETTALGPDISDKKTIHPKNQILYGPPGTGKTWQTVKLALSIALKKKVEDVNDEERKVFNDHQFNIGDSSSGSNGQIAFTTFHQNYAYEDFIEGIRPTVNGSEVRYEIRDGIFKQLVDAAKDDPNRSYVLIIDEINRGNIAKIFGELITLIEDSKRLGESDEKTAILPYSQNSFGVPRNLYIIGTMNTADRSIQILDTALRRRFTFVEMMPETSHENISTDIKGINCQQILNSMNRRIFALLDRERQIGHTYFFDVKTIDQLADVFRNRIIPLLQEYFFDDWSKIKAVLGNNAFVQDRAIDDRNLAEYRDSADKYYERLPADDYRWKEPEQFRKIYRVSEAKELRSE